MAELKKSLSQTAAYKKKKQKEIDQNYKAFIEIILSDLISDEQNRGKYALMRHRKVVGIYPTIEEVVHEGEKSYPDKLFSIQEITDQAVDLGFYSHVANHR